jgi:hypothetical protein
MTNTASSPRGRPFGWRKPPPTPRPDSAANVFTIELWCIGSGRSRTWLHSEWSAGRGPKRVRFGGKVLDGKLRGGTVTILESPREYFERVAREQLDSIAHGSGDAGRD